MMARRTGSSAPQCIVRLAHVCALAATFGLPDGRSAASEFHFPSTGITVDRKAVLLAIDDVSLPLKRNLCYYLSTPRVRAEPVLRPDREDPRAPDYLATHFYGTVLHDEGKFRMWYYPVHHGRDPSDLRQGPICYAESDDGIRWRKPHLHQVEVKGTKQNNAIDLPGQRTNAAAVIKDEADPDPLRRYKMVYNPNIDGIGWTIRTATSPDGLHWTPGPEGQLEAFVEMSSFYQHDGLFVVHGQGHETIGGEGGAGRGRQGFAWVSPDFDHWVTGFAEAFVLPEPADGRERGYLMPYPQVHLGVGAASFGNVAVGLYGRWRNPPVKKRSEGWYGAGKIHCDFGLVVSNDGIHFREPVRDHVYLSSRESPVTPVAGKDYPTILCQANGILNVGDETRIYHGRWRNAEYGLDYYAEVALATLPRDRWGALGLFPHVADGHVWTAPIALPEATWRLLLNADHADRVRVEIADERFNLLEAFSSGGSGVIRVDGGLDCPVIWPRGKLSDLAGRTVRFRIRLERKADADPRLYAVYLRSGPDR